MARGRGGFWEDRRYEWVCGDLRGAGRAVVRPALACPTQRSVSAAPEKFDKSPISQDLQLLANLLTHMLVHWVKLTEVRLELINVVESKFVFANPLYTPEDVEQPPARRVAFLPKKQSSLPAIQNLLPVQNRSIANDEDFSGVRNLRKQDVAPNPPGASGFVGKRFALLDDVFYEELLWDDEQVAHTYGQIVVEEH